MKAYLRSKVNPDLWTTLSKIKRMPKSFIMDFVDDIALNARFLLKKRKGFSSVACIVPFTRLELDPNGNVSACCTPHTKIKSVGNMNNRTIEQIWNGKELKRFRRLLFLGQTNKACNTTCAYLRRGPVYLQDIRTDTEKGASLYDDISNGRVELKSHPLRFNLANFTVCNLKCVMCHSRELEEKNISIPSHVMKSHENLKEYFEKEITIFAAGEGEVLARKDTRDLLQNFDSEKYSKVKFQIISNGQLFQPDMWETIKHNNFTYANISVDGATKDSYEKIRKGGKWERMLSALKVFEKAKNEGKFSSVTINMTVMRSNFKEIPQFIKMARAMGFYAFLKVIRGDWDDENIFKMKDREALQELRDILDDPDLYGQDVDAYELGEYIPEKYRKKMGDLIETIWFPSDILKPANNAARNNKYDRQVICN